jgi:hypothetical protein
LPREAGKNGFSRSTCASLTRTRLLTSTLVSSGDGMTRAGQPLAAQWVLNPTSGRTAGRQASRKGARPRAIGRKKGGLNAGLRMLSDGPGRPPTVVLSPGRMHDLQGALVLPGAPPTARLLPGERGCDAARFGKDPANTAMPPASRPGAETRHPPRPDTPQARSPDRDSFRASEGQVPDRHPP